MRSALLVIALVVVAAIVLPLMHFLLALAIVVGAAIFLMAVAKALFWPARSTPALAARPPDGGNNAQEHSIRTAGAARLPR